MRLVRELEDAGAAAVHIEDQVLPKKCGHLNDKVLVSTEQMAAKIAAAKRASRHLLIMARTDSAASEGLDGAIARARAYVAAGADIIVTATSAQAPLLKADWFKPGAFYSHVGGWEDEYEVAQQWGEEQENVSPFNISGF